MKNFQNKTKIIKASKQLRALARLGLIIWAVGLVMFLVIAVAALTNGGNARAIYLSLGGIVEMIFALIISLNFFRFFDRLKNGELFDAKTVSQLQVAGRWWLGYWLADFLFGIVGNGCFETKITFASGQLFASLIVIFVAWLMKEAQELQEEQELTV
jgi:hypothetical protein